MKRLTEYTIPETGFSVVSEEKYKRILMEEKPSVEKVYNRLKKIEDILGDDYDLEHLRKLVEADRDGRCVVLPQGGCTDQDGENALKSAMNTCFYHNNPVTRYIADAVAEKLTREAADVVPVVRCRECKYWGGTDEYGDGYCRNPDGIDNIAKEDDFCSYGERE